MEKHLTTANRQANNFPFLWNFIRFSKDIEPEILLKRR
jgi:hypothetical protein